MTTTATVATTATNDQFASIDLLNWDHAVCPTSDADIDMNAWEVLNSTLPKDQWDVGFRGMKISAKRNAAPEENTPSVDTLVDHLPKVLDLVKSINDELINTGEDDIPYMDESDLINACNLYKNIAHSVQMITTYRKHYNNVRTKEAAIQVTEAYVTMIELIDSMTNHHPSETAFFTHVDVININEMLDFSISQLKGKTASTGIIMATVDTMVNKAMGIVSEL